MQEMRAKLTLKEEWNERRMKGGKGGGKEERLIYEVESDN